MWIVRLPDGTRVASPSDVVVRERVKRLAQASVRFVTTDEAGSPA